MRKYLKRIFEADCEFAKQAMIQLGALPTTYIVRSHDGSVNFMVPKDSGRHHETAILAVKVTAIAHDAEAITSMIEAWALTLHPGDPEIEPSKSDRRIEIVSVRMETADDSIHRHYQIERGDDGACNGLTLLDARDQPPGEESGRMVGLMPRLRPTAAERKNAQRAMEEAMKAGALKPMPFQ